MKLIVGKDDNPVIVLASVFSLSLKSTEKGEVSKLILNSGSEVTNAPTIARLLARNSNKLYSDDLLTSSEIDHFIRLGDKLNFTRDAKVLNDTLLLRTFLTGKELSVADYICWAYIRDSKSWNSNEGEKMVNLTRWFNHVAQQEPIKKAELAPPKMTEKGAVKEVKVTAAGRKQEGTFVELEGAKMGEVVTRFPPEASGFLHIGHAKACLLNAHYQTSFKGKLIMRFDDTNPAKEKEDFEKIILKDVELLKVKPDIFSFTSDHFEKMLVMAEDMIKKGDAYCDDTPGEQMKEEREQRIEGKHRNNKPAVNMKMWEEMKKGSDKGKQTCLRAKMDMKSNNGALRDPAIYRVKVEPHPRHGSKYNVYPTYDFACPIVDSVEGVTHALRTTEYMDRDDQYFWFIEKLGLRKPHIWAYSRLNLQHTVLSKRKLTYFVEEGLVDGWDDPRMPTVRGVVRRGIPGVITICGNYGMG
jgi:bifunctional glutamyl/prolyl-tRNA synthetase